MLIASLWLPVGKGLASWLLYAAHSCAFATFPYGVLGKVWYLIVSIPDLCLLSYFHALLRNIKRPGPMLASAYL